MELKTIRNSCDLSTKLGYLDAIENISRAAADLSLEETIGLVRELEMLKQNDEQEKYFSDFYRFVMDMTAPVIFK